MNVTTVSLMIIVLISMILPASSIMYVSGSTDNSDSSDGGSTDNSDSSDGGSTDNSDSSPNDFSTDNTESSASGPADDNAGLSTTSENNPSISNDSAMSNNTGNVQGDLANSILAVHNQERAAVGVQPLTWSDTLAASAQAWAQHLATSGEFKHSPDTSYGENLAGFTLTEGVSAPGGGQSLWVNEKSNYVPGTPILESNFRGIGHYTQMVWKDTTQVGCGTATGDGHPFSILVCQYTPSGNRLGQVPY